MESSPLISPQYRTEQERLHATGTYGTASIAYAPIVSQIIERMQVEHVLDYGCGSLMNLAKHLKVKKPLKYQAYDPAVPRFAGDPVPAQMVTCIDVLEHIEPDMLDNVLDHLQALTEGIAFLTVHTGPAAKSLSDGRNAHLTQEPPEWWLPKFLSRWEFQTIQVTSDQSFFFLGFAKSQIEDVAGLKIT